MHATERQDPHLGISPLDPHPDYHRYRERAHSERSRAINAAMAFAWDRLVGRKARRKRDAEFWSA